MSDLILPYFSATKCNRFYRVVIQRISWTQPLQGNYLSNLPNIQCYLQSEYLANVTSKWCFEVISCIFEKLKSWFSIRIKTLWWIWIHSDKWCTENLFRMQTYVPGATFHDWVSSEMNIWVQIIFFSISFVEVDSNPSYRFSFDSE